MMNVSFENFDWDIKRISIKFFKFFEVIDDFNFLLSYRIEIHPFNLLKVTVRLSP